MAAAVRPSPPYREWVLAESAPLNWMQAVSHLDRMLDSLPPPKLGPRTADGSCSADIPIVPFRPKSQDFWRQFMSSFRSVSRQAVPSTRDCGVGTDLIHLETTLSIFRPYWFYRPLVGGIHSCCRCEWCDSRDSGSYAYPHEAEVAVDIPPLRRLTKSMDRPGFTKFHRICCRYFRGR